ncbi:hypothetical protein [Kitasatospora sp. HPMI-4]|uniref:hypothetical protein n=1 Tax=Kitasatospora sp. HPMI-4 TaxID=3448443 RepID=UPI003F1CC856
MSGLGYPMGKPQAHKMPTYDPSSGKPWRSGFALRPHAAVKAIKAARLAGLSVSGLLVELIERMPVDAEGRPTWAPPAKPVTTQQELPATG